jgi:ABC-type taurine transport system substrate-binding protein
MSTSGAVGLQAACRWLEIPPACYYTCHSTGHVIVVKTIPWVDDADEVMHVNTLCDTDQNAIVPARVVYKALKPPKRCATISQNDADAAFFTCVIISVILRASKQLRRSCGADAQSAFFFMVYVFQIKQ